MIDEAGLRHDWSRGRGLRDDACVPEAPRERAFDAIGAQGGIHPLPARRGEGPPADELDAASDARVTPRRVADELAYLSACLMEKYGHGFDVESEKRTFEVLGAHLTPHMKAFVAMRGDRIVAFSTYYGFGDTFHLGLAGQDYSEARPDEYAHFMVTYYAPHEYALSRGYRAVDLGLGAYDTKVNRGGELVRLVGFFHFDDPAVTATDVRHPRGAANEGGSGGGDNGGGFHDNGGGGGR